MLEVQSDKQSVYYHREERLAARYVRNQWWTSHPTLSCWMKLLPRSRCLKNIEISSRSFCVMIVDRKMWFPFISFIIKYRMSFLFDPLVSQSWLYVVQYSGYQKFRIQWCGLVNLFCFVGLNKEKVKNIENSSRILHKLKERSNFYA